VADYHLRFRLLDEAHQVTLSEDLEFHIVELPKFTKSLGDLTTDLDRWLYVLRHAASIDTDAVPAPLQRPLILRALGELKMLNQSDLERERYEARRKWQLDYNTGLKAARLEGREEGRAEGLAEGEQKGEAKGEQVGRIQLCERLLQRPVTPREQFAAMSLEDLTRVADDLQAQVLQQRQPPAL
jgi:predicted transposase/invertase (TIGR01784 family)